MTECNDECGYETVTPAEVLGQPGTDLNVENLNKSTILYWRLIKMELLYWQLLWCWYNTCNILGVFLYAMFDIRCVTLCQKLIQTYSSQDASSMSH